MPSPLALALMQQQPIAAPPQVSVTPTDVAQIYKNSQDAALQAYQAQLNQRNAMFGNLTALGRAGLSALAGPLAGYLFPPGKPGNTDSDINY